jgi:hypothetical protein
MIFPFVILVPVRMLAVMESSRLGVRKVLNRRPIRIYLDNASERTGDGG